jgi:hypothetical protein
MLDLIDSVHHFSFGIPDANLVIEPLFYDYKDISVNGGAEDTATLLQKKLAEIGTASEKANS